MTELNWWNYHAAEFCNCVFHETILKLKNWDWDAERHVSQKTPRRYVGWVAKQDLGSQSPKDTDK